MCYLEAGIDSSAMYAASRESFLAGGRRVSPCHQKGALWGTTKRQVLSARERARIRATLRGSDTLHPHTSPRVVVSPG